MNETNHQSDHFKEKEPMTEIYYLEAMDQMKEINDKRELESQILKDDLLQYKKQMLSCYGLLRTIDNIGQMRDLDFDLMNLIELARGEVADFIESYILCVPIIVESLV